MPFFWATVSQSFSLDDCIELGRWVGGGYGNGISVHRDMQISCITVSQLVYNNKYMCHMVFALLLLLLFVVLCNCADWVARHPFINPSSLMPIEWSNVRNLNSPLRNYCGRIHLRNSNWFQWIPGTITRWDSGHMSSTCEVIPWSSFGSSLLIVVNVQDSESGIKRCATFFAYSLIDGERPCLSPD